MKSADGCTKRALFGALCIGLLCLVLVLVPRSGALAGPAQNRVASTMVCADQYVLALVPAPHITGVSVSARDPSLSMQALRAASVAALKPDAETYLMTEADIVVGSEHGDTKLLRMLERLGVQVLRVSTRNSFPDIFAQLSEAASALGADEVGRDLGDDAQLRLAETVAQAPGRPVLAAFYYANGISPATGTYLDAMLTAAGYRSLASELGQKGWGRLDLETLVMTPPEAIVAVSYTGAGQRSQNRFFQHPVLTRMQAQVRTVTVPGALTACPNWNLVGAAEYLAAVRRMDGRP